MSSIFLSLSLDILLIIFICMLSIYAYFWYSYKYWAKRKIPYLEPRFPYGNRPDILCYSKGYGLELMDLYTEIKKRGWKLGGFYGGAWPVLMVTDPDYVKDILKKDFHHFIDRGFFYPKNEAFSYNLFALDETYWKDIRTKLTPTFTSGKMKMMFPLIVKASDGMIDALHKLVDKNQELYAKEYMAMFTIDVIMSCAFGLESDCFNDPEEQFRKIGTGLASTGVWDSVKLLFVNYAIDLAGSLGINTVRKERLKFFKNMIVKTINYRKQNNVQRNDFLQLVINIFEETKDSDRPFKFEYLVANVNLFFVAGFDTSSAALTFSLFELAKNPEIQERLRNEIITKLESNNGQLTYEVMNEMPYLQQVIDETLRIYPSVPILQRRCVKEYTFKDSNIVIEKGTSVVMPAISLHRDPEYFPDPMKFDPERFSDENKRNIDPNCYLPFGDGPRNCIGLRFGLMQTKIGLVTILKQFRLSVSPSTKLPVKLDRRMFLLQTEKPLYLKLERL